MKMKIKLLALMALLPSAAMSGDFIYENTFVRTPMKNGMVSLYCDMWGEPDAGLCWGPRVPDGEVWLIRSGGISNLHVGTAEWMMCIAVKGPNTNFPDRDVRPVIPLTRYPGYAAGTPPLAINQSIILVAGESLVARVNGDTSGGKRIGLRFLGFAFKDDLLPQLLGISPAASVMSSEDLARQQVMERRAFESR